MSPDSTRIDSSWSSDITGIMCVRDDGGVKSGAIGSNFLGSSLKILRAFLIGSQCFLFRDPCEARTSGCKG